MSKMNMNDVLKQAAQLQENLAKAQDELRHIKVEGSAGGGMVVVSANAKQEVLAVNIDPEVITPDDPEMLEDLVLAAVNQAIEKAGEAAQEHMSKTAGSLLGSLPGGLKIPGLGG